MWIQKTVTLKQRSRGFHLIDDELFAQLPELNKFRIGLANIFIQHTSASLTINENADPTVRTDFEAFFNRAIPENESYYTHTLEGSDDMPAHLKSSVLGSSLTIPIRDGVMALGMWQGIYLCEHRNDGGARRLIVTLQGEAL